MWAFFYRISMTISLSSYNKLQNYVQMTYVKNNALINIMISTRFVTLVYIHKHAPQVRKHWPYTTLCSVDKFWVFPYQFNPKLLSNHKIHYVNEYYIRMNYFNRSINYANRKRYVLFTLQRKTRM